MRTDDKNTVYQKSLLMVGIKALGLLGAMTGTVVILALGLPGAGTAQTSVPLRPVIIERIEIEGATKTKKDVIARYLTISPGDSISLSRLSAAIEADGRRLVKTNFFKSVDYYTRQGSERGKIVVVFEIKERKWPYFQFEGGHNDLDGWFFVPASLRFDNSFGRGNLLGLRFVLGHRVNKLSLHFRNPNVWGGRGFIDAELYGGGQEFIHYLGINRTQQNVDFGGARVKIGGNQGLFKHLNGGFRTENYRPDSFLEFLDADSTSATFPADLADDLEDTRISALSLVLQADSRDNLVYPLTGFWGALSLDLANDFLGSDRDFIKATLDARVYQRLAKRNVLAVHIKAGFTEESAPFFERFFLGGPNSLRGFRDRRLTPEGWASKLLLANGEFRFPISRKGFPYHKVSGVLFLDAGGAWLPGQKARLDDLFASAGLGFRVKLPVFGITRFDLAFPLKKLDNEDFQFHVSLGHTF